MISQFEEKEFDNEETDSDMKAKDLDVEEVKEFDLEEKNSDMKSEDLDVERVKEFDNEEKDSDMKSEDLDVALVKELDHEEKDYHMESEDLDVEETVVERLIGLTEMFPDSVRNVGYSVLIGTFPLIKKTYSLTRNISWIFFSSFAFLVVPITVEKERFQAQREINRQMLLGVGAQSPTGIGMAPAPVSK